MKSPLWPLIASKNAFRSAKTKIFCALPRASAIAIVGRVRSLGDLIHNYFSEPVVSRVKARDQPGRVILSGFTQPVEFVGGNKAKPHSLFLQCRAARVSRFGDLRGVVVTDFGC